MKTILFMLIAAISHQSVDAQNELASVENIPSHYSPASEAAVVSEPAISANIYVTGDEIVVNLGRGFGRAAHLQVLTPSAGLLFDKEISAGQKKIRVDLAGLSDGPYMVRVKMGNKVWSKPVFKG